MGAFDEPVNASNRELVQALANATTAKLKLIGIQYYDTKFISKEQITAIKKTIELFEAMGGKW